MGLSGVFAVEEEDIVRLHRGCSAEGSDRQRRGWVNVGRFAVLIELDAAGDLTVEAYPCGNEAKPYGVVKATVEEAVRDGALDADSDEGG